MIAASRVDAATERLSASISSGSTVAAGGFISETADQLDFGGRLEAGAITGLRGSK